MNSPIPPRVAYYRVSTERQGQSGLGLEAQRSAVAAYAAGRDLLEEFVEVGAAGRITGLSSPLRSPCAGRNGRCW